MVRQEGTSRRSCDVCRSVYEVRHFRYPSRDSYPDHKCQVCGNVLIPAARGTTHDYEFTLISRGEDANS